MSMVEKMLKKQLCEVTSDRFVIEMNMPKEYPPISAVPTDKGGVRERFFKAIAELPDEITVVHPFNVDAFAASDKNTLYVSPCGCDGAVGTKASPLATLNEAICRVRGLGGAKIILRGGDYNFDETVYITSEHSGTEASPLIITAEAGEEPRLSASFEIPHDAFRRVSDASMRARLKEEVRDAVLECDLKALGITDFGKVGRGGAVLLFNSKPQTLSRYPNPDEPLIPVGDKVYCQGWDPVEHREVGPWEIGMTDEKCLTWEENDDVYLFGALSYEWTRRYGRIGRFDAEKKSIVGASLFDRWPVRSDPLNNYFFVNVFEELDAPGEWYVDRTSGTLYFYPPHELTERDDVRFASKALTILDFNKAENVIVDRLNLGRNCGITVNVNDCRQVLIQRCHVTGTSPGGEDNDGDAVQISGGFRNGVVDTVFEYFTNTAASANGGDRKNLIPANNFVQNCKFVNPLYRIGLSSSGMGNVISHNYLNNTTMGDSGHNEGILEYNICEGGDTETNDTGMIYVGGGGCSTCGNHYRYNYFFDSVMGDYGIYFDDLSRGMYAYGNIVVGNGTTGDGTTWHAGGRSFNHHNGREHCYYNNISIDAGYFAFGGDVTYWTFDHHWNSLYPGILATAQDMSKSKTYMDRYPTYCDYVKEVFEYAEDKKDPNYEVKSGVAERHLRTNWCNHYENNLIVRAARPFKLDIGLESATGLETNFVTQDDPGFVDFEGKNYALKPDAEVFRHIPCFKPIAFEKMGPVDET